MKHQPYVNLRRVITDDMQEQINKLEEQVTILQEDKKNG